MAKAVNYLSYYHPLTLKTILFKIMVICRKSLEKSLHNIK